MEPIVHITSAEAWSRARADGEYQGDTFLQEGFIHASTPRQVLAVANARYRHMPDPILLVIDPRRLASALRHETGENGQSYPHIYGPLNLDAVLQVAPLRRTQAGVYVLPELAALPLDPDGRSL
jgi:uncharacterized protein (DUF952 family)